MNMDIFTLIFPLFDIFRKAFYPLGRAFEHSLSPAPLPQAGEGIAIGVIEPHLLDKVRESLPALLHRKL